MTKLSDVVQSQRTWLSIASVFVLAGCATHSAFLTSNKGSLSAPPSLHDWSEESDLRILYVHGMGDHPFGFTNDRPNYCGLTSYRDLNKALTNWDQQSQSFRDNVVQSAMSYQGRGFIKSWTKHFGYKAVNASGRDFEILRGGENQVLGYLFKRDFIKAAQNNGRERRTTFYIVDWALPAAVEKEQQFGSWDGKIPGAFWDFDPAIDRYRHGLNRQVKLSTIDWGLADAALYLKDEFGQKFRQTIREAIDRMANDLTASDRLVVVSASLGSTITMDALGQDLLARRKSARMWLEAPRQEQRLIAFYMFANQYGLLNIGREERSSDPVTRLDAALRGYHGERETTNADIQLVSFTDPDDLLSFPVKTEGRTNIGVCNVYVRNPNQELRLGSKFDVVLPDKAHINYEINPIVLDVMMSGKIPEQSR